MTDDKRFSEERMDAILKDAAAEYHRPPATPREAIWARIEAARQSGRGAGRQGIVIRFPVWRVVAAMAAVLVVGIFIGRYMMPGGEDPQTGAEVAAAPGLGAESIDPGPGSPVAYQVAASEHLNRVETFLRVFQAEARAGRLSGDEHVAPARGLLLSTRLLRESPAAEDLALRTLLDDLEVVLAQIAQYGGDRDNELEFIDEGIEQRSVLLKLRSAAAGAQRSASQGAL